MQNTTDDIGLQNVKNILLRDQFHALFLADGEINLTGCLE
jgi:hypothetical protein